MATFRLLLPQLLGGVRGWVFSSLTFLVAVKQFTASAWVLRVKSPIFCHGFGIGIF